MSTNTAMQSQETNKQIEAATSWWQSDDAWAMIMAAGLLVITWLALQPVLIPATGETSFENLLAPWVAKPGSWTTNPLAALKGSTQDAGPSTGFAILATGVGSLVRAFLFVKVCLLLPRSPFWLFLHGW